MSAELDEIQETQNLLAVATFPGVKAALQAHLEKLQKIQVPPPAPPMPDVTPAPSPPESAKHHHSLSGVTYIPIDSFSWDQGGYNSPIVSIFVDLEGVGLFKERVSVQFGKHSFDLKVVDLHGKNYRLVNNNLEKDIVPDQSTFIVKKNKVVVKLQKVKGEYSYEHWTALSAKKKREEGDQPAAAAKADPSAGIMEMMKNMYEDGDENMKRIIGEAMLKSQRGEKPDLNSPGI